MDTADRLTEMLYEEREARQEAQRVANFHENRAVILTSDMDYFQKQVVAKNQIVSDLRDVIHTLEDRLRQMPGQFQLDAMDRMEQAVLLGANEALREGQFSPFEAKGKIPLIKAVREKSGLSLKAAKDVCDSYLLWKADLEQAREEFDREDPGTFDDEDVIFAGNIGQFLDEVEKN